MRNMSEKGVKILVVDDEASLRAILSQVLGEEGHEVTQAASGEEALESFKKENFHLVITDIKMPGMNGIDLLREVKDIKPETQVIIMTSHASVDSAITALRHGAYDYLMKPFEDIDLISAVANRAIEKIILKEENVGLIEKLKSRNDQLELANRALKELAIMDGLTSVYNHRYFHEALAKELLRSRRYEHEFSIVFIDVDHFKNYNDTYGHPKGDKLLYELAQNVKDSLRKSDLIARYGGEEFVIILPETPKDMAFKLAEDLLHFIEEQPYEGRESQPEGKLTVSMGISTFPDDGKDGYSLIEHADRALYKAKESGRNQICK
jgi:diguanylate cyclase (GGDEF)-like protein